jgi:hypothetical protein
LRYFRDVDRREIDFVVVEDRKPIQCIECKWKESELNPALFYFKKRFPSCDALQIAAISKETSQTPEGIRLMPAVDFLKTLV